MSARSPKRWWRSAAGVATAGLAVGFGALGLYRVAGAEPIKDPLVPGSLSQPKETPPAWGPASGSVVPAGFPTPQVEPPKLPALPPPKPVPPSSPSSAPVAAPVLPTPAPVVPAPTPVKPAAPAAPTVPVTPAVPSLPGPLVPAPAPAAKEELPAPRPASRVELTPPAPPVKSAEPIPPAGVSQPVFNLQPGESRLTVNPSGPAAPVLPALPVSQEKPAAAPPRAGSVGSPVAPITTPTLAPGDLVMTIPTRQFVMSAVFGAALASAPLAPAQDAKAPTGGTSDATKRDEVKKDDNAELKKQLNNIEADVKSLQTFRKNLEDEVFGRGDGKSTADKGLLQRVTELETRLKKIEELLTQINSRLGEGKSTSAFGPAPAATTTAKSYVRVVNDYPTEMSLMINGKSHRLQPGEVKTVEVPPGSYTYELLHAGSQPITSTVKDGETVTLRIR